MADESVKKKIFTHHNRDRPLCKVTKQKLLDYINMKKDH